MTRFNPGYTVEERFWLRVEGDDALGCWSWNGEHGPTGYSVFSIAKGRAARAHRFSYEALIGPIPEGLSLDHLCRDRGCVNPYHLEPVTHLVNVRRGASCRATDEVCAHGHPWTEESTAYYHGTRYCRVCNREHVRAFNAMRRAAAA